MNIAVYQTKQKENISKNLKKYKKIKKSFTDDLEIFYVYLYDKTRHSYICCVSIDFSSIAGSIELKFVQDTHGLKKNDIFFPKIFYFFQHFLS